LAGDTLVLSFTFFSIKSLKVRGGVELAQLIDDLWCGELGDFEEEPPRGNPWVMQKLLLG
jgi:hypothetical protein